MRTRALNPRILAAAIVFVLLLVFVIQNTEVVQLTFLFWSIAMSRALLILFMLAIGAALGWFLNSYRRARQNRP